MKLVVFMVVTAVATGVLAIVIGNLSFGATHSYKAVFTDATGLLKGDDIRIAGVKVGSVQGHLHRRPHPRRWSPSTCSPTPR